jgi:serine/threonine protein phosphatase PrpC
VDLESRMVVASATTRGNRPVNADVVGQYRNNETGVLAVSLVNGIGSTDTVVRAMNRVAAEAARAGARRGARAGLLQATTMLAEHTQSPPPNGVMVLLVLRPGQPVEAVHVGNCRLYTFADGVLTQHTTDHTIGQRLRDQGEPEQRAARDDNKIYRTIATATPDTIALLTGITARHLLLTTGGVHKRLPHQRLTDLMRDNATHPQRCADRIVDASCDGGLLDNATAVFVSLTADELATAANSV